MYPDTTTNQLVHDTMIREELERHGPTHLLRVHEPYPFGDPLRGMRGATARALLRLAERIDPLPHTALAPAHEEERLAA
jgi:hypothetical protein